MLTWPLPLPFFFCARPRRLAEAEASEAPPWPTLGLLSLRRAGPGERPRRSWADAVGVGCAFS